MHALILLLVLGADDFRWNITEQPAFTWNLTEKGGDPTAERPEMLM